MNYEDLIFGEEILKKKAKAFAPILVKYCNNSTENFSIRLIRDKIKNLNEEEKCKLLVEQTLFLPHLADRILLQLLKDVKKADVFIETLLYKSQEILLKDFLVDKYTPDFRSRFINAFKKDQVKYRDGTWSQESPRLIQLFCARMCLLLNLPTVKPAIEATEVIAENMVSLCEILWSMLKEDLKKFSKTKDIQELKKENDYIQNYLEWSSLFNQGNDEFYHGLRKAMGFFKFDFEKEIEVLESVEKLYRMALAKLQSVQAPSEIHNFHEAMKHHIEQQINWISKCRKVAGFKNRGALLEVLKAYGDSEKRFRSLFEKEIREGEEWFKKRIGKLNRIFIK